MNALMKRSARIATTFLEIVTFVLVISFLVVVLMAVYYRYVINASLPWSEEFIRFSLFWFVLIASILVAIDDEHLRVELLQYAVPPKISKLFRVVAHVISIVFCIILFVQAVILVQRITAHSPALGLPMAWVYAAMVAGAPGIAIATFIRLVTMLTQQED